MTDDSSHQVWVLIMWQQQLVHRLLLFYIYFCVWGLYLRLNNINFHQSLFFIICIDLNHHCYHYWTSESLLNLWEYTQDSDITNKWVVYFVIRHIIDLWKLAIEATGLQVQSRCTWVFKMTNRNIRRAVKITE